MRLSNSNSSASGGPVDSNRRPPGSGTGKSPQILLSVFPVYMEIIINQPFRSIEIRFFAKKI